jgi:hypothetical protein
MVIQVAVGHTQVSAKDPFSAHIAPFQQSTSALLLLNTHQISLPNRIPLATWPGTLLRATQTYFCRFHPKHRCG